MSLSINDVIETLKKLGASVPLLVQTETELEALIAEQEAEKAADGAPKAKNAYVVLLLDPDNKLVDLGDFAALVTTVPEEDDAGLTLNKLHKSVYDYRATAKKPKVINTVVDAAEVLKRKYLAQNKIALKTKEPVRVLVSNNQIPAA